MLEQERQHMGQMVLHADRGQTKPERMAGRVVLWVLIVNHACRLRAVEPGQHRQGTREDFLSSDVPEVAEVRAEHYPIGRGNSDRVFHLRPDTEQGHRERRRQTKRGRRQTARAPQQDRSSLRRDPQERVIDRTRNRTVVAQKDVRHGSQPKASLIVIGAKRLLREVGTGGNDWKRQLRQQEHMERRERQQRPDPRIARRDGGGQRGTGT